MDFNQSEGKTSAIKSLNNTNCICYITKVKFILIGNVLETVNNFTPSLCNCLVERVAQGWCRGWICFVTHALTKIQHSFTRHTCRMKATFKVRTNHRDKSSAEYQKHLLKIFILHCVKSVRIRRYSDPYFRASGLNIERYGVSLRIQSECGKIQIRITPNMDTFYAVLLIKFTREKKRAPKLSICHWLTKSSVWVFDVTNSRNGFYNLSISS